MPDAKSLLPGRAFRSEHAQLRPEPHSIASHGPAPMDPLQTTRMRNGVLYAAEWPCCHDPLRLSLGSEDPFYIHNPRVRRARLRTPHPHPGGGGRARRALRVRAPPPRAGRRAPNAYPPYSLPATAPAARALRRARAGVASPPSAQVCPSANAAAQPPTLPPKPLRCVLCFHPPRLTLNTGKVSFTPASTLRFVLPYLPGSSPRTASAHPPPTRMHTAA